MSSSGPGTEQVPPQVRLAAEAYVYGYPLVYNAGEMTAFVAGNPRFPTRAPYNQFGHVRELAGPSFRFVSPNNDTAYSLAMCDVRPAPLVLQVPDTAGRYYVMQFIDAWTNNFAYVGRRATGTGAGTFLLVAPGYDGPVPDGMRVIHAPSGVFVIAGRTQVDGSDDLPAVRAIQDRYTLTPFGDPTGPAAGVPEPDPAVGPELEFWERFRVLLAAFPPPAADAEFLQACAALGLAAPQTPYADPDPDLAHALAQGAAIGKALVEELMRNIHRTPAGWQLAAHLFDYNLDYFEVGTLDDPEWKITDRRRAYATRAVVARAGLWGNHGYEADYAIVWVDGDGQPLDGSRRYRLRLDPPPPVDAFWSLTMYDTPDFYLVDNPIDRYSIGDRTPGLLRDADGSVTIHLQHESPGADRAANWLPTPAGAFRPIMRMYQPHEDVLTGAYALPPIVRVD